MIQFRIKKFKDLSIDELYEVLQLRSKVFVVEQDSAYLDVDFKDQKALHILGYVKNELAAYSRVFDSQDYFSFASIGRIVVAKKYRNHNYGNDLVIFSIQTIEHDFHEYNIHISAQLHLKKFYESHGFISVGEEYLEDGIPHIGMERIK